MSTEVITAIIALAGGVTGKTILDWVIDWARGRMDQAQKVQRRLDRETTRRRETELALHASQMMLIEKGVPPAEIPKVSADLEK